GFSDLFISYYSGDAHPSILFEGVKYRLCIILARGGSNKKRRTFVSDYCRWYANERPVLFQSKLSLQRIEFDKGFLRFSKVGSELSKEILRKMVAFGSPLERFLRKSGTGHVTYHRSPVFWIRSMDFEPFFKSAVKQRSTDHLKDIYFRSQSQAKRAGALLNSTCFYFWFTVQGNCR